MSGHPDHPRFHVASSEEIRAGAVTDVYFLRGKAVLEAERENPEVVAEIRAASLPSGWPWAVFAGLEEAVTLLGGRGVNVEGLPEGSVFHREEPVLTVAGRYLEFGVLETALLGMVCEASGVATRAARCKAAAGGKAVYSFGARRMHPAIAPMLERAAYVGGCDGVATVKAGEILGVEPSGTMAHALILILGEERAWRAFDEVVGPEVPRVALIDTFQDERFGAIAAAEVLGDKLSAVRLDTPASRRGDFGAILREVRWELDARGYPDVRLFVSGGLDEDAIRDLAGIADAFGVGTWISAAPVLDFSLDIVEVEGTRRAKRGKLSGRKTVRRCRDCGARGLALATAPMDRCAECGGTMDRLTRSWIEGGRVTEPLPSPSDVRAFALREAESASDPFA